MERFDSEHEEFPEISSAEVAQVAKWIEDLKVKYEPESISLDELGFRHLEKFYSQELLKSVKVVFLPSSEIPIPEIAKQRGIVPNDVIGICYGDIIFIDSDSKDNEALHFHELVHTLQYRYLGVEHYLKTYAEEAEIHEYRDNPLEVMAYHHQYNFEQHMYGGVEVYDVESRVLAEMASLYPHPD